MKVYVYTCTVMGCEDRQNKYCGEAYRCPFCGEGWMQLDEDRGNDLSR